MINEENSPDCTKISEAFARRLDSFESERPVRAIVMLKRTAEERDGRGKSRGDRRAEAKARRQEGVTALLDELEGVLKNYGGKRLGAATTLGAVPVEVKVSGIEALARLDSVDAILEDQPISLNQ